MNPEIKPGMLLIRKGGAWYHEIEGTMMLITSVNDLWVTHWSSGIPDHVTVPHMTRAFEIRYDIINGRLIILEEGSGY